MLLSGIQITDNNNDTFIWSVLQDMSEQKEVDAQIKLAKEKADALAFRMQLANDSAGIGVWEWDLRSNELVWDDWMYRLNGIEKSEFSGAYDAWVNSVHPGDIENAKLELESASNGNGSYEREFRVIHKNGQTRTIKACAEVVRDTNGEAIKFIGVNYDVTDKVEAMQVMSDARLAAENAAKAKSDFLANMSHEIRTPMNAILGGLQLLQNTELTPELKTVLNNASYSAKSLLTIINDILDYSKIEANNLQLEQIQFSFTEILDSVKYDLEPLISNKHVNFLINKEKNYNEYWVGDLVRIKQIILNLTSNAIKFTDVGKVEIIIGCRTFNEEEAVYMQVIDSGIGMSEEASKRIFERFAQADSSTTRKYGGTGLGMSITTNLIKLMNGKIDVETEVGKGTNVKVTLPLQQVNLVAEPKIRKALSAPNLSNKQILVAEDNAINRVLAESMLKTTKANVTFVDNGKLAVDATKNMTFDLVLMDIHMPVMDGMQAQQKIKHLSPQLPVIALTANVMKEDVDGYLQQGFVAHIAKPIDINKLYGTLKHYLL